MCHLCLASGDRSRDSSAKEIVSSIFHAANKRIRRSRDKSAGRMRDSADPDGTLSEPTSYSERNIDHEVELHRLQELLRTGGISEQMEDSNELTSAAGSHDSSVVLSTSSTASTETKDSVPISCGVKTEDSPTRRECLGSAMLKERRAFFIQNGCNQLTTDSSEQKRHSVDISQLTSGVTLQETVATCTTSDPLVTPVLSDASRSGDVTIAVPSSRADKLQHAAEQHMQQLADELQRTFNAVGTSSPPTVSPVAPDLCSQETAPPRLPELSAGDTAAKSAADSQSVTSDYSTMSSICGGQDDRRRNRLVSGDLDVVIAPGFDTRKFVDVSAVGLCRNRNEVPHSTPRSQSSGNFSPTNTDRVEASLYTASVMELSQDSIDSAADRSDQLSLSMSSQMSGSQISDSDDMAFRAVGMADKPSFSPVVQPLNSVDQKSCTIHSSSVEQFGEPTVAALTLQSDVPADNSVGSAVQSDLNSTKTISETDMVLDIPSPAVIPVSSEKQDILAVHVGSSTTDTVPAGTDHIPSEQKTDCCVDTAVSKVVLSADSDDKGISVLSSKEQHFVQSQHPVHRLVRRHTLGGTGDLAIHVVDPKSESPLSLQSGTSHDEERLSAWQRLKPAVKDQLPNFGMWLATQRQLHHVRSSPALFVGVALSPASCLHSSQLNCQPVV